MKIEDSEQFKEFANSIRLFTDIQVVFIPKKVEKILRMKRFQEELSKIHNNSDLAIEYCLIFLSNFMSIELDYNNQDKWKALSSEILLQQIPGSDGRYAKVIRFLKSSIFSSSSIIEVKLNEKGRESYEVGVQSKQYRLSNNFSNQGFIKYIIKSEVLKEKRRKSNDSKICDALINPIAKNLIKIYPKISLPTKEEISFEAERLVKNKAVNSKGKILTILKGRKKSNFVNFDERRVSYEDCLKSYRYLTENGLLVPTVSGERAGGRVCDTFNLMPSFIRKLIKIDNENVVIIDLKCLHPNLSMKLYDGNSKYLTHQFIAEQLKLDVMKVKKEHLSFFNMKVSQMKLSPLFEYYGKNEPKMLENLIEDKTKNGYKITCTKLFDLEVKIMTESIKRLNEIDIYPLYIFDALLVKYSNQKKVELIMNEVLKEMNICTIGVQS